MIFAGFISGLIFGLSTALIGGLFGTRDSPLTDVMALAPALLCGLVGALIGWVKLKRMKAGNPPWTREELHGLSIDVWIWAPFAAVIALLWAFMAWTEKTPFWLSLVIAFPTIWLAGMAYRAVLISRERRRPRPLQTE